MIYDEHERNYDINCVQWKVNGNNAVLLLFQHKFVCIYGKSLKMVNNGTIYLNVIVIGAHFKGTGILFEHEKPTK